MRRLLRSNVLRPLAVATAALVVVACGGSSTSQRTSTSTPTEARGTHGALPPNLLASLPEGRLLVEAPTAGPRYNHQTFVIDGSAASSLAPTEVSVSADGRYVSYVERPDDVNLPPTAFVVRRTSGEEALRLQLSSELNAAWSPTGSRLAYQLGHVVYVRDFAGADQLQFDAPEDAHFVSWFAGGSALFLVTQPPGAETKRRIYILDATSGANSEVVLPPDAVVGPAAEFVSFSPDGRYAAYPVIREGGNCFSACDLWMMEIATGRTCLLMKNAPAHQYPQVPSWSPDSRSVTYFARRDPERGGYADRHVVDAESCANTAIEPTPPLPTATQTKIPAALIGEAHLLSPSGRYLLVYSVQDQVPTPRRGQIPPEGKTMQPPSPGHAEMYVVDRQTGSITTLVDEDRELTPVVWLP